MFATQAQARINCTFAITNLNFGHIDLTANAAYDTTGTFTANCTGGSSGQVVRVCPNINAGSGGTTTGNPRFMLNGSTKLNFNLFQDAARTIVWGSYLWGFPAYVAPTINIPLNGSGSGSATATIYGRVSAGQQTLPPGAYTSSFSGGNTRIAYDKTTDSCAKIGNKNATSVSFTVSAAYSSACHLASTNLSFGSAGLLTSAVAGASTLTVTCSMSTPYTIGLNGGNANASDPTQRKMASGSAQITYGLYRDPGHSAPWGATSSNWASGAGSGSGQALTVYGLVPAQTTPTPAAYADTIVATVTY
ncbi:MAG: spore coat protein U domain-containing protein [Methylocystis sp.]|nr:spore coat protein U domain-containing protein [Methylocystis sp.]